MKNEIYGAKALVYLKYEGDIATLARKLGSGLLIPEFCIEERECPPHDLLATCEVFGLEAWLESSVEIDGFAYSFKVETEHSLEESFNDRMHDLSLWLARFIFSICEVETFVPNSDGCAGMNFSFVSQQQ
ncbi:hypothetical protein QSV34_07675 [Porticoccus sp. W117]|uniref:hypothetical protein n=1 Tax=Porticoccus sp. W117 TaxID=3054777 RepID=UPI002595B2FD|nr:hypothetical protein [Porticoccus sp. W117]MDM3871233.1 hypothetical protein [Porticoccus sp. W117]